VVAEARTLAAGGARELVLVAQDLTAYGMDRYGAPALDRLLTALDGVEEIRWIRLLYANPFHWTPALIDAMAGSPRVAPYADIPIQHIADPMLKLMGRRTSRRVIETLVADLRARVPGIALRTSVIVGFPGETEAHFEELCAFLEETRFDKLVVFPFSPEEGSAASRLPHPVPPRVAQERRRRVLALQGKVSREIHRGLRGRLLDVLIEEEGGEGRAARGRSAREAPEVDGVVRVAGTGLRKGRFYPVRITGGDAHDLVGIHEPAGAPLAVEVS
jgi:ribosomal protein S12 methylthiotransferase